MKFPCSARLCAIHWHGSQAATIPVTSQSQSLEEEESAVEEVSSVPREWDSGWLVGWVCELGKKNRVKTTRRRLRGKQLRPGNQQLRTELPPEMGILRIYGTTVF